MKKMILWIIAAIMIAVSGLAAYGHFASDVDQAPYTVLRVDRFIEIRQYPELIFAQTSVSGGRESAINSGFRKLAGYIFGGNKMPGENANSQNIAMTAPVLQQEQKNKWIIRFVMPKNFSLENLPIPDDGDVSIQRQNAKIFAVIRFSGVADEDLLQQKQTQLRDWLARQNMAALSEPIYAFFNPPWTLPFMRRNEIMIETVL